MNLEAEILKEHSKRNTVRIANWVGGDRKRFRELMDLFLRGEHTLAQRAAWIVRQVADEHPVLIAPYLDKVITRMLEPGVHVAAKRNVIGTLQNIEIPRRLQGRVVTVCFDMLESNEPIAVKCFALTVLANIAKDEPDLKNELRLMIEHRMQWESAAFKARGKMVLKQLSLEDTGCSVNPKQWSDREKVTGYQSR